MQLTAYCNYLLCDVDKKETHRSSKSTKTPFYRACFYFLLLGIGLLVSSSSYSQKINLSVKNASLQSVFKEIEKQSGFRFFYKEKILLKANKVTVTIKDATINQALQQCLVGQPYSYSITENIIVINETKSTPDENPVAPITGNNEISLRGTVKDAKGNPISSVSVVVPGTPFGSITNEKGEYYIGRVPETSSILASYVGFIPQTISVKKRSEINIVLQIEEMSLDEAVVIGYGTTTKRLNPGAVSSIKAVDIAKQTIDNPLTALQGRVPGVSITQDNGLPGGGVRVQVRGINSAAAGTIPLYVIDGVPFTLFSGGEPFSDALNAYGTSGANGNISPFSMIAPEDILRIDILKDADATAIYGSRGSNGVILITTKKGTKGKTVFNFNVNTGFAKVNRFIPMMSGPEYFAMRREAFNNSGVVPDLDNAKDLLVWDTTKYTDWQRWAIGGTAPITNATGSVSGGNQQTNFLFSSTYRNQGTVFPGSYRNNTFSNRLNVGHKSQNERFNIDVALNYSYMDNNLPSRDLSGYYNLAPNFPPYNPDGTLNFEVNNPYAELKKSYSSKTTNFISSLNVGYKVLPSLTLKTAFGYTLTSLHQLNKNPASSKNISPSASPSVRAAANELTYFDNDNGNYIIEPQLNYKKALGVHQLDILAGTTFQQNKADGILLNGTGFSNESLLGAISNAANVSARNSNYSVYKYNALFGRINYNYDNKYIVDAVFRRDGSSRFGPNNRFGNFGAIGGAWIFTKEKFMESTNFLSFGKLRASYGITGNDQISNYQYSAFYNTGWSGISYQGTGILNQRNPANPELQWESTTKLDIALDLSFFNERLSLKADYYLNRSSNQLVGISLASQSGYNSYTGNLPATIQNRGLEFELTSNNISSKDFTWTTTFNLTLNRNKLVAFPDLESSSYNYTYIIGQPIDVQQLYQYAGVDKATGSPTFVDQNKDNSIGFEDDRIPMKIGTPYYGGLTNNLTYKGFSLDFTFQFNHRYGFLNNTLDNFNTGYYPYGYGYYNQSKPIVNRWSPTNTDAFYPAAGVNFNNDYFTLAGSDYNWGDASFIKLKTVSLQYAFRPKLLERLKLRALSIYAQGQNLHTWAKQKYTFDPETTQPGTGVGLGTGRYIAFPQLQTIVFGFNVSF